MNNVKIGRGLAFMCLKNAYRVYEIMINRSTIPKSSNVYKTPEYPIRILII